MAIIDNLISYWMLDTTANDSHTSANHLSNVNGVVISAGAAHFTAASSQYLNRSDNASLSIGASSFTFVIAIFPETLTSFPVMASKGWEGINGANEEWVLFYNTTSSRFTFNVCGPGAVTTTVPANTLGAGSVSTSYFIVLWHDLGNTINIQINNGGVDSIAHTVGVQDGNRDFVIGASILQSLYWDGYINKVAFWKRVLTASERTWLYNSGAGRTYAEIVTGMPEAATLMGVILM